VRRSSILNPKERRKGSTPVVTIMAVVHPPGIKAKESIITIARKRGIRWRNPQTQMKNIHHSSIILTGEPRLQEVDPLENSAQLPLIPRVENPIITTIEEVSNGNRRGGLMKAISLRQNRFALN